MEHRIARQRAIIAALATADFVRVADLEDTLQASAATVRRDIAELARAGRILKVHGGAARPGYTLAMRAQTSGSLAGDRPLRQDQAGPSSQRQALASAAAGLCLPGQGIILASGGATRAMCRLVAGMQLQVLTDSLEIATALLQQDGTRVLLPAGTIAPDGTMIVPTGPLDPLPRFHADKAFFDTRTTVCYLLSNGRMSLGNAQRLAAQAARRILLFEPEEMANCSELLADLRFCFDLVIVPQDLPAHMQAALERSGIAIISAQGNCHCRRKQ